MESTKKDQPVMSVNGYPLTQEQLEIIKAVRKGQNIKIIAYAGAGKTSTLQAIAKYHVKKTAYICYNKALAQEAKEKFTDDYITVRTAHAYARQAICSKNSDRWGKKLGKKLLNDDVKKYSQFNSTEHDFPAKDWTLISGIKSTVNYFLNSADAELSVDHVPDTAIKWALKLWTQQRVDDDFILDLKSYIAEKATLLARAMSSAKSACPATHDCYLKLWQLSKPKLDATCLLFDEGQDSNPVLLDVILQQSHCQIIIVGDPHQAIYSFRNAINALSVVDFPAYKLSQSFRYGNAIASYANHILGLKGEETKIKGFGDNSEICDTNASAGESPLMIVCRTNIAVLEYVSIAAHYKLQVSMNGGLSKHLSLLRSAQKLKLGQEQNYREIPFELKPYKTWQALTNEAESSQEPELKRILKIFDASDDAIEHKLQILESVAEVPTDEADLILLTAHGSKGTEADYVMLGEDFDAFIDAAENGSRISEEEINLLYVAVTRAKKKLYLPPRLMQAINGQERFDDVYSPFAAQTAKFKAPGTLTTGLPSPDPTDFAETNTEEDSDLEQPSATTPPPASHTATGIPVQLGSTHNGTPMYWEPNNTKIWLNQNIASIGTMGTGKTQFCKSVLYQLRANKDRNVGKQKLGIMVFDFKDDYCDPDFLAKTGGKLLTPHKLPINPFVLYGKKDNPTLVIQTIERFVASVVTAYRLGVKQETRLRDVVYQSYQYQGIDPDKPETFFAFPPPTISLVWQMYELMPKLPKDSLYSALDNIMRFKFFDTHASGSQQTLFDMLDDSLTVFDVKELDGSIQDLFIALMLDSFFAQMQTAGKPAVQGDLRALKKLIVVDEADNIMRCNFRALERVLKEGREYGVGVMLSTQQLSHFRTKKFDYASMMLCWVIHNVASIDSADVRMLFNTKRGEEDAVMSSIRQLVKHESLFVDAQKNVEKIDDLPYFKLQQHESA